MEVIYDNINKGVLKRVPSIILFDFLESSVLKAQYMNSALNIKPFEINLSKPTSSITLRRKHLNPSKQSAIFRSNIHFT